MDVHGKLGQSEHEGSDIVIKRAGGEEIHSVKSILTQKSSYFRELLSKDPLKTEVVLDEDAKVMGSLIFACHVEHALLSDIRHTLALLELAEQYGVEHVKSQCLIFLLKCMPQAVIECELEELRQANNRGDTRQVTYDSLVFVPQVLPSAPSIPMAGREMLRRLPSDPSHGCTLRQTSMPLINSDYHEVSFAVGNQKFRPVPSVPRPSPPTTTFTLRQT